MAGTSRNVGDARVSDGRRRVTARSDDLPLLVGTDVPAGRRRSAGRPGWAAWSGASGRIHGIELLDDARIGSHTVSRHDGVVSVLRAFSAPELGAFVDTAVRATGSVRRALGFRLVASWGPATNNA